MKLETAISIHKTMSNTGPEYVEIELTDQGSRITFAEVTLTVEEFASALFGLGYVHCTTDVRGLDKLGKLHEHKTENIPRLGYDTWENRYEMIAPYEVDGWKADPYDLKSLNHHNVHGNTYSVIFRRWVDPPTADEERQA